MVRKAEKVTLTDILGDDVVVAVDPDRSVDSSRKEPSGRRRNRIQGNGMLGLTVRAFIALGVLGVLAFPTFLIVMVGMAPTLVGLFSSHQPDRIKIQTIAAFNMSGVILFLVPLWTEGHSIENAIYVLSNVYSWAVMYSAAALGFAVLWLGPQVVASVLNAIAVGRRRKLDAIRSGLIEEWGTGILPDDAVVPHDAATKGKSERPDAA